VAIAKRLESGHGWCSDHLALPIVLKEILAIGEELSKDTQSIKKNHSIG